MECNITQRKRYICINISTTPWPCILHVSCGTIGLRYRKDCLLKNIRTSAELPRLLPMPKPVQALSGRMQPPSNVTFGRAPVNYDSISKTAFHIEGDHKEVFKGPSTEGDRQKVLDFVVGTHFILGDEILDYNTTKNTSDRGYVGGGPSSFDADMLKTLRASSIKLGSERTEYQSQSRSDYVNNFNGPIQLARGQDVREGGAFVFGDEISDYGTEQRQHFKDRTVKGKEINNTSGAEGSGRAIPPSNVYLGGVKTDYRRTSIAHREHPGNAGREKSCNVTELLQEGHVVLGDDEVDYSKKV